MKPETVALLRKLAREATIFALLGMLVAGIAVFVVMDNEDRTNAKRQAAIAVHATTDANWFVADVTNSHNVPRSSLVQVQLSNGTMLQVRRCKPPGRMVPAFAPDGSLGDIPIERAQDAVKSGFKLVLYINSGRPKAIPVDGFHDAVQKGFWLYADPDPAVQILSSVQGIDNSVRSQAWNAFYQSKNENDLATRLQKSELPQPVKNDLSDAKRSLTHTKPPDIGFSAGFIPKQATSDEDCRDFSYYHPFDFRAVLAADRMAIERDYWTAYKEARHHDLGGTLLGTLYVSLLGFPAGLVLWIFFRLVWFAVRG